MNGWGYVIIGLAIIMFCAALDLIDRFMRWRKMTVHRLCSQCGQWFPLCEFGAGNVCKVCAARGRKATGDRT